MSSDTAKPAVDGEDEAARQGGKKKPGKEKQSKEKPGKEGEGKPTSKAAGRTTADQATGKKTTGEPDAEPESETSREALPQGSSGNEDDLKSRFRDALKRKQAHGDGGAGYAKGEPKVHEVHGSTTRKRQFRRKSG